MQKELKEKFPEWCGDTSKEYSLILSDDIDSLASCYIQNRLFGRNVEYFMDFNSSYIDENGWRIDCQKVYRTKNKTENNVIGIDIAIEGDGWYTWDNHVTRISSKDNYNTESANLNTINGTNYFNYYDKKFAGSTLITMLSYYSDKIDISKWSEEMKMILCCTDSLYTCFDVWKRDFRPVQRKYLKELEMSELIELMEFHVAKNKKRDFEELKQKYNLDSKIYLNPHTHKLETKIDLFGLSELFKMDLSLPDEEFEDFKIYDKHVHYGYVNNKESLCTGNTKALFNLALVKKDMIIYSTRNIIA
ncbi:conserved hypothetical protein [Clostridium carboxidivorans P7]|uniref:Uncharacterized protein n=1 Tax=Clostridium carboxidivorans P7 TaxID=536227 RepID=C6Q143_9CLOT|nr:hypothetical protein [Clostridium carboxidivorans]EET84779.1 conserved hypothetical protein [Clostridium carboxidivorans P7]